MSEPVATIFRAAAIRDASPGPSGPVNLRPGAIAVRQGRIVAVGEPDVVEKEVKQQGPWRLVEMPDRLILPAMVNAHAHLDLTDIGPVPYEAAGRDFIKWIEMVIARRPKTDETITAAVRRGLRMSREAGVETIYDIAGSSTAMRSWYDIPLLERPMGVSFLEQFGFGEAAGQAARAQWSRATDESIASQRPFPLAGCEPHAPYSAGPEVFAAATSVLCSAHLAETLEEDQFVRTANGPFADFLRRIGKWHPTIQPRGLSAVQYFLATLRGNKAWVLAHCNYLDDDDISALGRAGHEGSLSVAYCPVASDYFGHRSHRYQNLLEAGVNVCLGTDSIVCQSNSEPQPLGILPQMRHLYRRDRTRPTRLLRMATTRGLRAFGFGEGLCLLLPQMPARLNAVRIDPTDATDPLVQALLNDNLVEPICIPIESQGESAT